MVLPSSSVTESAPIDFAVRPRWKTTPFFSWVSWMKPPSSRPRIFSNGIFSGAATWTSSSRARSDAATSSPMNDAPITTAFFEDLAAAMMARLSASERR